MRVLWMKSDYIMPPDTGGKIRTYNLMRELNQLCPVSYLSFRSSPESVGDREIGECASEVFTIPRAEEKKSGPRFYARVLRGMASSLPYTLQKYRAPAIVKIQREWLAEGGDRGSIILCDFLEMAENVDWSAKCPKVLFQHNVESVIWRRHYDVARNPLKKVYFGYEHTRLNRYEASACNRFDLVFAVSERDKTTLEHDLGVHRPIRVLETGVDTDYFAPRPGERPVAGRLLFLGSMDWMPNIDGVSWFVEEVYPSIRAARPEVSLDIVGRRPGREVYRLAEREPSIRVIPDVPDVRPHIASADLFIVPLRVGGGSRIKIYEAMSMGRPVVSTSVGAEGLPLGPDRHVFIGDSAEEFSNLVVRLREQSLSKESVAAAGEKLVRENFGWRKVAATMRDACQELLGANN